jgi:co-chaperonin GroES (HSP10)
MSRSLPNPTPVSTKRTPEQALHPVFAKVGTLDFEQTLAEAFPDVDSLHEPNGSLVLLQIRSPKKKTRGGIIIPNDVQETEKWNTQIGKVIKLGPLCYCNRTTRVAWPEGAWCKEGDFVRIGKYDGDRWSVPCKIDGVDVEEALFVLVSDLKIGARVTGDPRNVKAFI